MPYVHLEKNDFFSLISVEVELFNMDTSEEKLVNEVMDHILRKVLEIKFFKPLSSNYKPVIYGSVVANVVRYIKTHGTDKDAFTICQEILEEIYHNGSDIDIITIAPDTHIEKLGSTRTNYEWTLYDAMNVQQAIPTSITRCLTINTNTGTKDIKCDIQVITYTHITTLCTKRIINLSNLTITRDATPHDIKNCIECKRRRKITKRKKDRKNMKTINHKLCGDALEMVIINSLTQYFAPLSTAESLLYGAGRIIQRGPFPIVDVVQHIVNNRLHLLKVYYILKKIKIILNRIVKYIIKKKYTLTVESLPFLEKYMFDIDEYLTDLSFTTKDFLCNRTHKLLLSSLDKLPCNEYTNYSHMIVRQEKYIAKNVNTSYDDYIISLNKITDEIKKCDKCNNQILRDLDLYNSILKIMEITVHNTIKGIFEECGLLDMDGPSFIIAQYISAPTLVFQYYDKQLEEKQKMEERIRAIKNKLGLY